MARLMTMTARLLAGAIAMVATVPHAARADDGPRIRVPSKHMDRDTTYGRLEGDVTLVLGAGATLGPNAPRGTIDFRARYLDTAGLFVSYEDGALVGSGSEPRRVLATGLELRPLFLARLAKGWEWGSPRLDLMVDSFGLEIGASFAQPTGAAFASRAGLQLALGLEVPILERASGPFVGFHGGVRFGDSALSSGTIVDANDRAFFLSITLAWHQVILTHLVDAGDRGVR